MSALVAGGVLLDRSNGGNPARFTPPDASERVAAIGEIRYLPDDQQRAFAPSPLFSAKREPGEIDWLANHEERGQTFDQFLSGRRNRFEAPRRVLYVQPLGDFPEVEAGLLERVEDFAELYFQAEVTIQPAIDVEQAAVAITRRHHPGPDDLQYLSTDVLEYLQLDLPDDAYARLAVTMTDLYPDPSWNFVFGQASLLHRVGVYSFARYGDPAEQPERFLRRCLQVFVHETGHMFGMHHCIHFECLMNGSNSLRESDAAPLHLCPVCLRKLHAANTFDLVARFRSLAAFCHDAGLAAEAEWYAARVAELE